MDMNTANTKTIPYMTAKEVSELLGGMSRTTLINNAKRKHLPNPIRIGTKLLWNRSELLEALENNRETFEA